MKKHGVLRCALTICILCLTSVAQQPPSKPGDLSPLGGKDTHGSKAFHVPIEKRTLENNYFRQVIFTGKHLQLALMSLPPQTEIGPEIHDHTDQFFRIERGEAKFIFNEKEVLLAHDGDAVIVPAGTRHNVLNSSKTEPLKMYTLYAPPNHPDKTVHKTKEEAEKHH